MTERAAIHAMDLLIDCGLAAAERYFLLRPVSVIAAHEKLQAWRERRFFVAPLVG
jgi:hypothetical protein